MDRTRIRLFAVPFSGFSTIGGDLAAQFKIGSEALKQKSVRTVAAAIAIALAMAGCASGSGSSALAAPLTTQGASPLTVSTEYRIGPGDTLAITVFQVPDLTLKEAQVDANGRIALPLIGSVTAGGRTTAELATEIATKLEAGFLQSPQVSVIVSTAVSQKVTVDGAVTEPGVFTLKGRTTLMQVVAMAKGPKNTANLKRVAVFRNTEGERTAAVFDLSAIRSGKAEDPEIVGNDVVVVDSSALKGFWREVVAALPSLAIFRTY